MLYDLIHGIGYLMGYGMPGFVVGLIIMACGGGEALVGLKDWVVAKRRIRKGRRAATRPAVQTVKVHAADIQFWLDRRETGTPGEQEVAGQMLDFLGYVEPVRLSNHRSRRDHLLTTLEHADSLTVIEACRAELTELDRAEGRKYE